MATPKHLALKVGLGALAAAGTVALLAGSLASCSSTPTPVSVRTFERAGRMDVVCLKISEGGVAQTPVPVAQANCAPVADGTDTTLLPYHLYAVITQTLRGEVAIVDLTASRVVDVSRTQPGVNFIPVGQNPTDVVSTPDGKFVFVASAEVNKPGIYAIPSDKLLGDALGLTDTASPRIVDLPSCGLPQAPGRMAILPGTALPGDAGAADGGDAGATSTSARLAVLLPGDATTSAKVVTIDISSFADGTIGKGSLAPCKITSAIALSGQLPAAWSPGSAWGNGIPYVDGGVDLFAPSAALPNDPQLPLWAVGRTLAVPVVDAGGGDGGDAGADGATDAAVDAPVDAPVEAGDDAGADAESYALKSTPGNAPHGRGLAFDGRMLYVGDDAMPLVHVIDTAQNGLVELDPYVATSLTNPSRIVTTTEVAVSPTTHDFKRYLYALDDRDGSIIVFDATDPTTAKRSPMLRPNAELVPAQPPDRIRFAQPITTFAFVRHDVPLSKYVGAGGGLVPLPAQKTGLQCNPNRGVEHGVVGRSQGPFSVDPAGTIFDDVTLGANYRANVTQSLALGPARLRGLFAFVTLSNGYVAVVDVDDWDAACRRPAALAPNFQKSSLQIPQTDDPIGFDPYRWSDTARLGGGIADDPKVTTDEAFFPIAPPNRQRSFYYLKDDPLTGKHVPYIPGSQAQLFENGAPVTATQKGYPMLVGANVKFSDKELSGVDLSVSLAKEDPTVHVDQEWAITYEGALPGFDGIAATLATDDDYRSLTMSSNSALFCRRGVEDRRANATRRAAIAAESTATTFATPRLDDRLGDYVQITDDIMFATDPYWSLNDANGNPPACWDVPLDGNRNLKTEPASVRQQVCADKFGLAANQSPQRDFPILEAYDDRLVLGRYLYTDPTSRPINGRVIAPRDSASQVDFKLAQCCFHNQARFRVRTGGQWVTIGSVAGYLHHISADANKACVPSTSSREVLLNSRIVEFTTLRGSDLGLLGSVDRNSAFAVRNPIFSAALRTTSLPKGLFTASTRDLSWRFGLRGGFTQQGINLAAQTTAVVPQSMSFIDSIGRLAVVDGSSQGLILISLDSVAVAGSPFF
jgi:DNA-binding beta-propeller fold protein YncE